MNPLYRISTRFSPASRLRQSTATAAALLQSLSTLHFTQRSAHIRPRKIMRDPKERPMGDFGTHIDEFEGELCQASSAIKADLDANLSPQRPVSPAEAQKIFESVGSSLPLGLYGFLVTSFTDIIIILKEHQLMPKRNEADILAQWLSIPEKKVKEADLAMRMGPERWGIVRALLERRMHKLDEEKFSPAVRRLDELGLDPGLWKNFLRNAMLYISTDRAHRRQLAEVFRAIREGTVPASAPLAGDFRARTITLARLLLGIAREFGSNTLAEFALDLIQDCGQRADYKIIKEIMYANAANRRRWMDAEIRGSGELKQHLVTILSRYIPKVKRDREANFDIGVLGGEAMPGAVRAKRPTIDQVTDSAPEATEIPAHLQKARAEAQQAKTYASAEERERDESFVIHSILPSIGSQFYTGQTTTKENYKNSSIAKVMGNILTPMTEAEAERARDTSKINAAKYTQPSLAERKKLQFLQDLERHRREAAEEAAKLEEKEKEKPKRVVKGVPTSQAKKEPLKKAKQRSMSAREKAVASRVGPKKPVNKSRVSKAQRRAFGG